LYVAVPMATALVMQSPSLRSFRNLLPGLFKLAAFAIEAAWLDFSFLPFVRARRPCAGRLLLIVTSGPHTAPMVGAARTTKENSMSTVLTIAALQSRSDLELQTLLRKARYEVECTVTGSIEQRDALATLENITTVMRVRAVRPRPPGF
jgi:hypothetical protein